MRPPRKRRIDDLLKSLPELPILIGLWTLYRTGGNIKSAVYAAVVSAVIMLAVLIVVAFAYRIWKRKKLLSSGMDVLEKMSGTEFEEFILAHLGNLGYLGSLTPTTEDYGADLVLEKDGRRIVVQAKRWKQVVGVEAIQQIVAAIKHYDADKGMVITNSTFTENAYTLAKSNGVELWDRVKLSKAVKKSKDLLVRRGKPRQGNQQIFGSAAPSAIQSCPKCGNVLVVRNGKYGQFWGCSGFPRCRYTKNV